MKLLPKLNLLDQRRDDVERSLGKRLLRLLVFVILLAIALAVPAAA